jgi:hypothetical protein
MLESPVVAAVTTSRTRCRRVGAAVVRDVRANTAVLISEMAASTASTCSEIPSPIGSGAVEASACSPESGPEQPLDDVVVQVACDPVAILGEFESLPVDPASANSMATLAARRSRRPSRGRHW